MNERMAPPSIRYKLIYSGDAGVIESICFGQYFGLAKYQQCGLAYKT